MQYHIWANFEFCALVTVHLEYDEKLNRKRVDAVGFIPHVKCVAMATYVCICIIVFILYINGI